MVEGEISQGFRMQNKIKQEFFFLQKIKQNELISKKHEKVCATLIYIEHALV